MKTEVLNITLSMPPSNVNNMYQRIRSGGIFKNPEIAAWEVVAKSKIKKEEKLDAKPTYTVNIGFYFGNHRKNDIDSKIKIVLDLLQHAGVFEDDKLVSDLIVAKRHDHDNPRCEVSVY